MIFCGSLLKDAVIRVIYLFFRTGAAHLIAEVGENNEYCQDRFIQVLSLIQKK